MTELRLGHLTNERSLSPPSPTAQWSDSHEISVQASTLQFGLGFRSQEASTSPQSSPTRSPIDLRAYPPSVASSPARWRVQVAVSPSKDAGVRITTRSGRPISAR